MDWVMELACEAVTAEVRTVVHGRVPDDFCVIVLGQPKLLQALAKGIVVAELKPEQYACDETEMN